MEKNEKSVISLIGSVAVDNIAILFVLGMLIGVSSGLSSSSASHVVLSFDSFAGQYPAYQVGESCPTNEVCDNVDNDEDGQVDEGFDLLSDSANCGVCGRSCDASTKYCFGGKCVGLAEASYEPVACDNHL